VTTRSTGSGDGRTRRRADTRQRLYESAVDLIAERGYDATTVEEIALRAGVAKGTVYYNFPSKNALFEALLRHGVDLLTESFRDAVAGLAPRPAIAALVVADVLRTGVQSGDLPADLDVDLTAAALFGAGLVVAVDWLTFQPERSIDDVRRALLAIVSDRMPPHQTA
jgi:AcrR family transcriptional regulator